MYLEHFGLSKAPFKITPDTHLFYEGGDRGALLHTLCYAVDNGEGITKVVGEVGTGKTMLCRMLPQTMGAHIDWIYLAHPSLSPEHTLHAIAFEMGLRVEPTADKLVVMRQVHESLLERHLAGRRVVVMVEEAQGMPLETLEEIRLLSNLETQDEKLMQIILFGQPELDVNLAQPQIRQLRERITHSVYLSPLNLPGIHDYVNFRMRAVGYKGPDVFSHKIARALARYSGGLIRRINILADKALIIAFTENRHEIRVADIKAAARDSEFYRVRSFWSRLAA